MDLICSRTTFMYQNILNFEKMFNYNNNKKILKIKKLLELSTSLNKFAVHLLYKYKGFFENDWDQGNMYQDGINYIEQFTNDIKNIKINKTEIPEDILCKKPKIIYKEGFRLVNHYANIYYICIDFLNDLSQEDEINYFKNNIMRHLLRMYSMAERLEEKRKEYEKKPNSNKAIEDIMKEVGRYDYDPLSESKQFKKDEEKKWNKKK